MEPLSRDEVGVALEPIAPDLERIEKIMVDVSTGATSFLTESTTYLTKAGGKRLRPALTVLSAQMGAGPNPDVDVTAAAIEMTHLATLYHDDVIDEADLRRGVPSANQKWGNKVAILAGDYLFARASKISADVGGEVPGVLADAIALVVQGQIMELQSAYDPKRSEQIYLMTIAGKTAALLEACTRLGCSLAGCSPAEVEAMRSFGVAFGNAFQIADDMLDLAASLEELGKAPGTDLRDGVYTLPVILASESNPKILDLLGSPDVDVEAVRDLTVSAGGFERARKAAVGYVQEAMGHLSQMPACPARETLEQVTKLVVDRVPEVPGHIAAKARRPPSASTSPADFALLEERLDGATIPKHLAVIPDGNRRWAHKQGLSVMDGHRAGFEVAKNLSRFCRRVGIHTVTIWAFSTENWRRSAEQVSGLMDIFRQWLCDLLPEAVSEQVKVVHLGRLAGVPDEAKGSAEAASHSDGLPADLREAILDIEEKTAGFDRNLINLAINYGGADEIQRAFEKMRLSQDPSREENPEIDDFLDTAGQLYPRPDIVWRTSGEFRSSGFLPLQSAYAEMVFTPKYFPELNESDLVEVILEYSARRRRFGR